MLRIKEFLKEEKASGVVELILIIVVLIGLVVIFKDQLTFLVYAIFETVFEQAGELW